MEALLSTLELDNTIFRSDHASNYLVLRGVLDRDKPRLLDMVRTAIRQPATGKKQKRRRWSPIRDATLKVLRNRPGQKLTVAEIRTAIPRRSASMPSRW